MPEPVMTEAAKQAVNPLWPALIGMTGTGLGALIATVTQFGIKLHEFRYGTEKLITERRLEAIKEIDQALMMYCLIFHPPPEGVWLAKGISSSRRCHRILMQDPDGFMTIHATLDARLRANQVWISIGLEKAVQELVEYLSVDAEILKLVRFMHKAELTAHFANAEQVYPTLQAKVTKVQRKLHDELRTVHNVKSFLSSPKW